MLLCKALYDLTPLFANAVVCACLQFISRWYGNISNKMQMSAKTLFSRSNNLFEFLSLNLLLVKTLGLNVNFYFYA